MYRDASGTRKEARYAPHTPIKDIRDDLERLQADARASGIAHPVTGSLADAVERWARLEQHLASWKERRAELRAWVALHGHVRFIGIKADHVRVAISTWSQAGVSAKTIRNRLWTLKHLYKLLRGHQAPTPVDHVQPPAKPRTLPTYVSAATILAVYHKLREFERQGRLHDAKTRARFMVRAATGRRPKEIMRAKPGDVNLERREWRVRDAKGGWSPGLYLNDDALAAWETFIAADAWGEFNTGSMAEVLRAAGWPEGSRPYDMRASVGIDLSERGTDLADVGSWLGHTSLQTTRSAYVPILNSRMQRAGEALAGRLNGFAVPQVVPQDQSEHAGFARNSVEHVGVTTPAKNPRKPRKT
jgi:integrase